MPAAGPGRCSGQAARRDPVAVGRDGAPRRLPRAPAARRPGGGRHHLPRRVGAAAQPRTTGPPGGLPERGPGLDARPDRRHRQRRAHHRRQRSLDPAGDQRRRQPCDLRDRRRLLRRLRPRDGTLAPGRPGRRLRAAVRPDGRVAGVPAGHPVPAGRQPALLLAEHRPAARPRGRRGPELHRHHPPQDPRGRGGAPRHPRRPDGPAQPHAPAGPAPARPQRPRARAPGRAVPGPRRLQAGQRRLRPRGRRRRAPRARGPARPAGAARGHGGPAGRRRVRGALRGPRDARRGRRAGRAAARRRRRAVHHRRRGHHPRAVHRHRRGRRDPQPARRAAQRRGPGDVRRQGTRSQPGHRLRRRGARPPPRASGPGDDAAGDGRARRPAGALPAADRPA